MNRYLTLLLGFGLSGIGIFVAFKNFDFGQLVTTIQDAHLVWFLPAILLYLFEWFLRVVRWQVLLSPLRFTPMLQLFPVLMLGFFLNNVLPARGGELARAYAANRKFQLPLSSCLGTIAAERAFDLVGLIFIVGMAASLVPWEKLPIRQLGLFIVAMLVLTVIGFFILKWHPGIQGTDKRRIRDALVLFIQRLVEGFLALRSFRKIAYVAFLSISIWVLEAVNIQLISRAFQLNLGLFEAAALVMGLSFGVMIPAAPGYVGTYEFFGKQTLVMLGYPEGPALAFVVILHFYQLLYTYCVGIPSLIKIGFSDISSAKEEIKRPT